MIKRMVLVVMLGWALVQGMQAVATTMNAVQIVRGR